jgi:zinc carboxypeptidase
VQRTTGLALALALLTGPARAQHITTPQEELGFSIGDDYRLANYTQLEAYWKKLASESDRMQLIDIGPTSEGRRQHMAIVTSPANLKQLDRYKDIARRLALAEGLTDEQAHALARGGKSVVWIDGGLHASETVGSQQLMETVYEMVSRSDPETMRLLDDVIGLYVPANPDGQELVANWYMREKDPLKRSLADLPALYHKYAGHDDNRDFYASNLAETTNMNRQMWLEWFPQIVYDHHQTGPAGTVIFMPPFRDPFNYNLDPLVPLGVELVGAALHSRLVAEGKGGSTMRSGANYSTWWNGGLRTIAYFHNSIGILTEIIGNPTPITIPLVPEKQLPTSDLPLPIAPQTWHYRQSIEYEMTNNRAILDLASRYRETFLYNIYQMGRNSIEAGNRDHWTITPKRIRALQEAEQRGGRDSQLYQTVLHDPQARDPRGYILPSDQPDFSTATKFVNALLRNGVTVMRAASAFEVNGKKYAAGSYVVKAAQAFRPHVLDMFEPQDHPDDLLYPGGPPRQPYDITGWTLAMQMGVQYDRVLDGFDGPFQKIGNELPMPQGSVSGPAHPAGYLISHRNNNAFTLMNRLLKAGCEVDWLRDDGTIWVPESAAAREIVERGAKDLGLAVHAEAAALSGPMTRIKAQRIGLYDQYGGIVASGWTRWVLEQFEFPYQTVYPRTLDAGELNRSFDVLVFPDGVRTNRGSRQPNAPDIPEQFRPTTGTVTQDKTVPQIRSFAEAGGDVVTLGSATELGQLLGLPVREYVTDRARESFYVPGSLLRTNVDPSAPMAYGMPPQVDLFFDNNPVFKNLTPAAAWFSGTQLLTSGWAFGQKLLDGGTVAGEASLGKGKVYLIGPDVTFRGQPHATFKLLLNTLYGL